LVDVVGKAGAAEFRQSGDAMVNAGITVGLTVTVIVLPVAHCPARGVKVYDPVAVLLTVAGSQVPVIPLFEVVGSIGAVEPEHKAAIEVNVGAMLDPTVTVTDTFDAH
jgi:hypothetical protein